MTSTTDYESRRLKHAARLGELMGSLQERISWHSSQLNVHRQKSLEQLLSHAMKNSPWHRHRLEGLDPASIIATDLTQLPTMDKDDLMANWDEIVTDSKLNLAACENHLAGLTTTPEYLNEQYHVLASGGSSGKRGVYVYGWDEWVLFYTSYVRWMLHGIKAKRLVLPDFTTVAVGGKSPTHATVALGMTFSAPDQTPDSFPVWLPLTEIVDALNRLQPKLLTGYATAIKLLAAEAQAGRLQIDPIWITTSSEPLLPEIIEAVEQVWQATVVNTYGTSDVGIVGSGCGVGAGMHLNEDLMIIEPVDADGNPIPAGQSSAKIYVTSLYQYTLPMIRYELTDEISLINEPCPCGSVYQRIRDVEGRQDDLFSYAGGIQIHPHLFRSPLSRQRNLVEYQVTQTTKGARIVLVCSGDLDSAKLEVDLCKILLAAGLQQAEVSVKLVDSIARIGVGKLRRFIPLR